MTLPTIPADLKKAIESNRLILFTGSGISLRFGFPDWKTLVVGIIEDLSVDKPVLKHLIPLLEADVFTPLEILDKMEPHWPAIWRVIKPMLEMPSSPDLSLHQKIRELCPRVITTNYDRGFELAWDGNPPNPTWNNDPAALAVLADHEEFLFKIHGTIEHSDIILFTRKYEELYKDNSACLNAFNLLLMRSTILFIGFNLSDPYISQIILKLHTSFKGHQGKHYFITTDKAFDQSSIQNAVIPLRLHSYDDLPALLDQMILLKPRYISLPTPSFGRLIGKDHQVDHIIGLLAGDSPAVVISGERGIGKSSLALELALRSTKGIAVSSSGEKIFFTHAVWIRFNEVNNDLNNIHKIILEDLFHARTISDTSRESQRRELKKLLSRNKTLIILDNIEEAVDEKIFDWIMELPFPSKALLTVSLSVTDFTHDIVLEHLTGADALTFLTEEVSKKMPGVIPTEQELSAVTRSISGNPYAMLLAIACIRKGSIPDAAMLDHLKSEEEIRFLQEFIWSKLDPDSRKAMYLFAVFGQMERQSANRLKEAGRLMGIENMDQVLGNLIEWSFIVQNNNRYGSHN